MPNQATNQRPRIRLPIGLLILELIGSILLALGLADGIAGTHLVPKALQFSHYPLFFGIWGVLLILPFNISIIRQAIENAKRR